jgi:hypothetical protein
LWDCGGYVLALARLWARARALPSPAPALPQVDPLSLFVCCIDSVPVFWLLAPSDAHPLTPYPSHTH